MRKYLLFIVFALALVSCGESNKLIGTWVKSESGEVHDSANIGIISTMKLNSDGTYEERYDLQASNSEKDYSMDITSFGKWEMPSEEKLILHFEKTIIKGYKNENKREKRDVEYTIIKVDDEILELMAKGQIFIYVRKK